MQNIMRVPDLGSIKSTSYSTRSAPSPIVITNFPEPGMPSSYDRCSVNYVLGELDPPKAILQNLVLELVGKAEKNGHKIRELKLAKRFVEVLLSEIESV